ncbi:hypothetical protein [Candidatus Scalindua japonica]|uniref:hypothetical protein n=1 Tax=Candidatus Scalindua japonica TaxID=1284222 RepID=UPI0013A5410A|nr:hypothetical protein [Candidatus Scalindua japonica]
MIISEPVKIGVNAERYDDARNLCNRILSLSGSESNAYSKYAEEILARLSKK